VRLDGWAITLSGVSSGNGLFGSFAVTGRTTGSGAFNALLRYSGIIRVVLAGGTSMSIGLRRYVGD
jgi:hypothetical protein